MRQKQERQEQGERKEQGMVQGLEAHQGRGTKRGRVVALPLLRANWTVLRLLEEWSQDDRWTAAGAGDSK